MKTLKIKFIAIASSAFLLVLILVLGLVNLISYINVSAGIFSTLEIINENRGSLPGVNEINEEKFELEYTPETSFETRYFTVMLDKDMMPFYINTENIAAVSAEEIVQFINDGLGTNRRRGYFLQSGMTYAFLKQKNADGTYMISFLDCTSRLSSVRFYVKFSVYIGVVSMLLLFLILSFFSRKAVAPLIRNMESQKEFITNASHELKTPLAVISANADVIEMMNGESEWTEGIKNQVRRMSELVSQLIVLSKLQEREDLVLTDVNFSEKAQDVVDSLKVVAQSQNKEFESEIKPDIMIHADERGARELVSILVDNAVKYCDDDGKVYVKLESKGKKACLTVANNYKAGEKEDFTRFFERFYRADHSHNSEIKGYGIGLSMAESLVDMFSGKISVGYKNGIIIFTVLI